MLVTVLFELNGGARQVIEVGSAKTEDAVWPIVCFQQLNLRVVQSQVHCGHGVGEVFSLGRADDWTVDRWLGEDPGQRDLGGRDASLVRYFYHGVDDGSIVVGVESSSELVALGAVGLLVPG